MCSIIRTKLIFFMSLSIIQDCLLSLKPENIQDSANLIIESESAQENSKIEELVNLILFANRVRTKEMEYMSDLLAIVLNNIPQIKASLIESAIHYHSMFSLLYLSDYHLLRLLIIKNIVTIDDVCSVLLSQKQEDIADYNFFFTQIAVLGEYIEQYDAEQFADAMDKFMGSVLTADHFLDTISNEYSPDFVFQQWLKFIQRFHKNWDKQNQCFANHNPINSLAALIINDNFDEFQSISSDATFDQNEIVPSSIFEASFFLKNDPSLIQYSAFYGAIKIFKFLFLNSADLSHVDTSGRSIVHYAIAGNNLEIIHLLEQKGLSYKGTLPTASLFCHYGLFEWLLTTEKCEFLETDPEGYTCFGRACQSDYLRIIQYCIDNDFTFNVVSVVKNSLTESKEAEELIRKSNIMTDEEINEMKYVKVKTQTQGF